MTCKDERITSSGKKGKRRKYQGGSAYNESTSFMSHQNDVRRSAENVEVVHLAVPRVVRETNYNICQYNWNRSKSSNMSKFSKRSNSRKRYISRKRSKYWKRSKYKKSHKSMMDQSLRIGISLGRGLSLGRSLSQGIYLSL